MEKQGWKLFFIVLLLHVIAYAVLVQESWLQSTLTREQASHYAFLGEDQARYAETRASNTFNRWFVNSGVMSHSFQALVPTPEQRANSKGIENLGSQIFPWMEKRIRAWWTLVYQVLLRFSNAMLWWPFFVLAAVPFFIDALVVRRVKATTFGLTSPHLQGIAARSIPIILLGYFLVMFAPVFIHPAWVPAVIFVTSAALWMGVSQFVKRG